MQLTKEQETALISEIRKDMDAYIALVRKGDYEIVAQEGDMYQISIEKEDGDGWCMWVKL